MAIEKKMTIEIDVWCTDARHFHDLVDLLRKAGTSAMINGTHGGYGFDVPIEKIKENDLRKALGFKKSEVWGE